MKLIAKLFGQSPFAPLQEHMQKVSECCDVVCDIAEAFKRNDEGQIRQLADKVSLKEHEADQIKNDIRLHLPKTTFLPVNRGDILDILSIQDAIADVAEDVGVLLTMRSVQFHPELKDSFDTFMTKVRNTFKKSQETIELLNRLFEVTFGGPEAKKVEEMIEEVCYLEHEADIAQMELLQNVFRIEKKLSAGELIIYLKVLEKIGNIANYAEKLANRIRTLLLVD